MGRAANAVISGLYPHTHFYWFEKSQEKHIYKTKVTALSPLIFETIRCNDSALMAPRPPPIGRIVSSKATEGAQITSHHLVRSEIH